MGAEPDLTTAHVRRARGGDAESLSWVVGRFSPLLLAQARYRLGPRLAAEVDPEDLVQDAWATALPRLAGLDTSGGRGTPVLLRFLSTTLLHRVNNLLRRHATAAASGDGGTSPAFALLSEETRGPLTRALAGESCSLVTEAIDALGERDRELVILRGIERIGNEEAGRLLGLSPNATAQAYRRALAKLRERLPSSVFDELE